METEYPLMTTMTKTVTTRFFFALLALVACAGAFYDGHHGGFEVEACTMLSRLWRVAPGGGVGGEAQVA